MIKLGLFGLGHLGKIHFKCLKSTDFELAGIYDPLLVDTFSYEDVPLVQNQKDLIEKIDAAIVASTTTSHYELTKTLIENGKHVFVEKPLTSTIDEAAKLVSLIETNDNLVNQVGFVERYNPAYSYLSKSIRNPKFMEVHRLGNFVERGTDVSVVNDLMIHDLDLIMHMKSGVEITDIRANGVTLLTDSLDICNARLEFADSSVANITASRMSMKSMRKFRIFQESEYLSMDLAEKKAEVIQLSDSGEQGGMEIPLNSGNKYISIKSSGKLEGNAILAEQKKFYDCIVSNTDSDLNFRWAYKISQLAEEIENIALKAINS